MIMGVVSGGASLSAMVETSQATFRGLTEIGTHMLAGFLHGTDNHIKADVSSAGEKGGEVKGIHSSLGGNSISFDTGNLYQTTNGITGESQLMLHSDFSGILNGMM